MPIWVGGEAGIYSSFAAVVRRIRLKHVLRIGAARYASDVK